MRSLYLYLNQNKNKNKKMNNWKCSQGECFSVPCERIFKYHAFVTAKLVQVFQPIDGVTFKFGVFRKVWQKPTQKYTVNYINFKSIKRLPSIALLPYYGHTHTHTHRKLFNVSFLLPQTAECDGQIGPKVTTNKINLKCFLRIYL